jgi:hypothetical protein
LHYHTDPVLQNQLDKLIFVLPKAMLRRAIFSRMLGCVDAELNRNADRIRDDYVQRLERSVATFEKELKAAVTIVADNLRFVLEPRTAGAGSPNLVVSQLAPIISQCSALG